jgi:hypothetical protein
MLVFLILVLAVAVAIGSWGRAARRSEAIVRARVG